MRQYRTYTDQDFINAVANNKSIAGVLKELGLVVAGGNYIHVKKNLQKFNLNTDHWTGQLWSKGEQLKDWSQYTKAKNCKQHLLKLKGNTCQWCGLSKWLDKDIKLELDHIDGNRTNNSLENLRLLCPNCHSFTPTWRKQKRPCRPTG